MPLSKSLILVFFFIANIHGSFDENVCLKNVQNMLQEGLLASNDSVFFLDDDVFPSSNIESPVLTLDGCNELCGKEFGWYKDIGPRFSTWLIPVFFLLSNMEVSPLDKRRYLMLLHLVGDPIDSLWSLLLKLEAWCRCYRKALKHSRSTDWPQIRNQATILGCIDELVGFHTDPLDVFNFIRSRATVSPERFELVVSRTAQQFADSRCDNRLRTLLATVLYIYQVISAFITTVGGGNTTPPGGRIGITMFMTWIIPSILLSNAIGGFTSSRSCFSILENFIWETTSEGDLWAFLQQAAPALQRHRSLDGCFNSLAWSGAIYTYRPSKKLMYTTGPYDRGSYTLLFLATSPVIISSVVGSVIIYNTPPIAINCRNMLIFAITILVFLSTLFTWVTTWFLQGAIHWYIVLVKDVFLAIPSIVLLILATAGLFNSCWCWSGVYSLGARAHVPLNPVADFLSYNRTTYPLIVGVCLTSQILVFMAMMWVGWSGWNVLRWSEEEKREEWRASRSRIDRVEEATSRIQSESLIYDGKACESV